MATIDKMKVADDGSSISSEEYSALEEEAKDAKALYTLEFKRPFTFEGETYRSLDFDFDKLTGKDSIDIEMELQRKNISLVVPAFSGPYILRFAARACTTANIGIDMLEAMPHNAWLKLRGKASSFLFQSET